MVSHIDRNGDGGDLDRAPQRLSEQHYVVSIITALLVEDRQELGDHQRHLSAGGSSDEVVQGAHETSLTVYHSLATAGAVCHYRRRASAVILYVSYH